MTKIERKDNGSIKNGRSRLLRPRPSTQYDNSIHGFNPADPRMAVNRLLRGSHIAEIVRQFDRRDFPPVGFPNSDWFDNVLRYLLASGHAKRFEAISQVAQLAQPKQCPVVLSNEGRQIRIWNETVPRLYGSEYRVIELLVNEFPTGMTEADFNTEGVLEPGKILKRICKKFRMWDRVIIRPRKKALGGYKLLASSSAQGIK
jgi:hypothetical protein